MSLGRVLIVEDEGIIAHDLRAPIERLGDTVSVHADLATRTRIEAADPAGFILKPFHHGELEHALERALTRKAPTGAGP
jgi:hypothetical protein